jgi:hypothetical protein
MLPVARDVLEEARRRFVSTAIARAMADAWALRTTLPNALFRK